MSEEEKKAMVEKRHERGLYSIKELQAMFGIGRVTIDYALNSGQLKWMSPNGSTRFVFLKDFMEWMEKGGKHQ